MNCENCKQNEKQDPVMVPLISVESADFRREKTLRGSVATFVVALLIIALIVGACGVFVYQIQMECLEKIDGINRYWIDFISQYDFEDYSYEYSQDGKGLNIIGDNNGVNYGPEIESEETDDAS